MAKPPTKLKLKYAGDEITVIKKIGEGGQGIVYLVNTKNGSCALKWYFKKCATDTQGMMLKDCITNPISKDGGINSIFLWPQDIAYDPADLSGFGYIMNLIDKENFCEIKDMLYRKDMRPEPEAKCLISHAIATAYSTLHLTGRCYRDISEGNIVFNPRTGSVLICDNDNIGPNHSDISVIGTDGYMAPEIYTHKAKPSEKTDRHSLAVLLFYFWVWHHPLEGAVSEEISCFDKPAMKMIYGSDPHYAFDEKNPKFNLPKNTMYAHIHKRYEVLPEVLKKLFHRAFTVGLKDPDQRVMESDWQMAFAELIGCTTHCPKCGASLFWDKSHKNLNCWHCSQSSPLGARLKIQPPYGTFYSLLNKNKSIYQIQIDPTKNDYRNRTAQIAEVVPIAELKTYGIKNCTKDHWTLIRPTGEQVKIPPSAKIRIISGSKIILANHTQMTIVANET